MNSDIFDENSERRIQNKWICLRIHSRHLTTKMWFIDL